MDSWMILRSRFWTVESNVPSAVLIELGVFVGLFVCGCPGHQFVLQAEDELAERKTSWPSAENEMITMQATALFAFQSLFVFIFTRNFIARFDFFCCPLFCLSSVASSHLSFPLHLFSPSSICVHLSAVTNCRDGCQGHCAACLPKIIPLNSEIKLQIISHTHTHPCQCMSTSRFVCTGGHAHLDAHTNTHKYKPHAGPGHTLTHTKTHWIHPLACQCVSVSSCSLKLHQCVFRAARTRLCTQALHYFTPRKDMDECTQTQWSLKELLTDKSKMNENQTLLLGSTELLLKKNNKSKELSTTKRITSLIFCCTTV